MDHASYVNMYLLTSVFQMWDDGLMADQNGVRITGGSPDPRRKEDFIGRAGWSG